MSFVRVLLLFVFGIALGYTDEIETRSGNLNRYILYNWSNRGGVDITNNFDTSLIDSSRKTVVLVHGHEGKPDSGFSFEVSEAFLYGEEIGQYDIIVVDWSGFAGLPYQSAVAFVSSIASGLASAVDEIIEKRTLDPKRIHFVGFDLGAHVAGIAARRLTKGKIARITGLDPSGDGWGVSSARLTSSDANYVEVIHTDAIGVRAIGVGEPIAHVDFFPNGGTAQPGCGTNLCNHIRAYELFAASLYRVDVKDHLVGNLCYIWTQMTTNTCTSFTLKMGGYDCDKIGSGVFRLTTGRTFPF